MKKLFGPLLALLLLSQAPSFAQTANLVLVIDKSAQTMDWLDGFSITRDPATLFDNNTFGPSMISLSTDPIIGSPLLNYSGAGSHSQVIFEFSQDRTRISSINLGSSAPPGPNATFSGTAAGPATPTFLSGDFTKFALLNQGEYTLPSQGIWSGGIHVVVTGQPTLEVLRPKTSEIFFGFDRMVPGSNFRIVWRTQGVSGGTDWKFYLSTINFPVRELFATAADDGGGNWHADAAIPSDLHSTCNYTLRIHDDVSGADGLSDVFCVGRTNLVLVIDQSAQTMDWLDGYTVTRPNLPFSRINLFGFNAGSQQGASISSPLLNYSGEGHHNRVTFFVSQDLTRIEGIDLGIDELSSRSRAGFSGTVEGPVTPTFVAGDFSLFANLSQGEHVLDSGDSGYNDVIRVVVTNGTPRLQVLRPKSSDQLHPGSNFRFVWRTQGVSGGTEWKFYFDTNNVHVGQLFATAVDDGGGNWHANVTIPNEVHQDAMLVDLPSACNYTLRIHDEVSGAEGRSEVFCLGMPVVALRVSQVEICWSSRSNRLYQVRYRSQLTTNTWTSLDGPVQGNGATNCVTDPVIRGEPQKYYRVEELP